MKLTKTQMSNLKRVWTSRIAFNLNAHQAKAAGFKFMNLNPRFQLMDLGLIRTLKVVGTDIEVMVLTDLGRTTLGV